MITEEILEVLKCASPEKHHFCIDPIILAKCGHSICKKCIPKDEFNEIKCGICGLISEQDLYKFQVSKAGQSLLKMNMENIFKIIATETSLKIIEIKENLNAKNELLKVNLKYIEKEIDMRVESLIIQVTRLGDRMKEKLKDVKVEARKATKIDDFDLIFKELEENIKKKMNLTEDYLGNFQTKMKGLNSLLDEIRELKFPDFKFSTDTIDDENIIGHFTGLENKFKLIKEVTFEEESYLCRMTLIENNTKLLITDIEYNLLRLLDLDGNILTSFNPNNILTEPAGVCILKEQNEEKIFIGEWGQHRISVFNSNFDLQFQFSDENLKHPWYMRIDNVFNHSRLYVSDHEYNIITIWNTNNGAFIDKIDIDTPCDVNFTESSLYVSSRVFEHHLEKNGNVRSVKKGGNCIFLFDKESLQIKRRIIGNWYSPRLINIELNGNLNIVAYMFYDNITPSEIRYFLRIDQNGKIIEKVEIDGLNQVTDSMLVNNKIIASIENNLNFFELE